jgi:hypothetical protein
MAIRAEAVVFVDVAGRRSSGRQGSDRHSRKLLATVEPTAASRGWRRAAILPAAINAVVDPRFLGRKVQGLVQQHGELSLSVLLEVGGGEMMVGRRHMQRVGSRRRLEVTHAHQVEEELLFPLDVGRCLVGGSGRRWRAASSIQLHHPLKQKRTI